MHYTSWIYVAVTPLVGLLVRRARRRAGINLAEAIVVALYATAASNFLALLSLPLHHWATTPGAYYNLTLLTSLGLVACQSWAYEQRPTDASVAAVGRWWRGIFTAVCAYGLVMVGSLVLMLTLNWSYLAAGGHKEKESGRRHAAAPAAVSTPAPPAAP